MKNGYKIALGGTMSALSMVFMMLTGVLPMAEYALPALAGIMLVPVVAELGRKWALLCWLAVSLLSFFLAPMKESALLYIAFLGYYPILKSLIEGWRKPVREWAVKFLCFNLAVGGVVGITIFLFGIETYVGNVSSVPLYIAGGILLLNVVFLIYDMALTRLISAYYRWFRPRYIRKLLK